MASNSAWGQGVAGRFPPVAAAAHDHAVFGDHAAHGDFPFRRGLPGQRQRLTIARALVPKPKILILDDSASALDFATDAALRKAIKEETHGMTVFIVSQRAASVQRADHILVLDDGKLVGDAPHAELLRSCEVYKEICLSQLSKEEVAKTL